MLMLHFRTNVCRMNFRKVCKVCMYEMKVTEIGQDSGIHGRHKKCIQNFGQKA
jgi:hypothetical protein